MTHGETMIVEFDEQNWTVVCERLANQARKGCGNSGDYYIELFSTAIDTEVAKLPETQRARALEVATEEWDYATSAERQAAQELFAESGCCSHGITLGCCPAGCGS